MNGACPTPGKVGFGSRRHAKAEAKRVSSRLSVRGQLRPYLCHGCGQWHLTHLNGKAAQLDRRRRRRNERQA